METKHYSEVELDALAQSSAAGPNRSQDWNDEHLLACAGCREKAGFLRDYYAGLAQIADDAVHPGVAALARPLQPPRVVALRLFSAPLQRDLFGSSGHTYVLAAQSASVAAERFVTLASFASEESKALVRVVMDHQRNELVIRLLAEGTGEKGRALIAFGGISGLPPVLADPSGVAHAPAPGGACDWANAGIIVSYPLAAFSVPGGLKGGESFSAASLSLQVAVTGNLLCFEVVAATETVRNLVALDDKSNPHILQIVDSRASLPHFIGGGVKELFIY
jgi:hypothetical protein